MVKRVNNYIQITTQKN